MTIPQNGGESSFKFDLAISFAGPERLLAEQLALAVREAGFEVFYDEFYADALWGEDLAEYFDRVYREESRFCVIFKSQEYLDRMWTVHERRSAVARMLADKGRAYILPIQVDPVDLPGIPPTIGHMSLDRYSIHDISNSLIRRLGAVVSNSNSSLDGRPMPIAPNSASISTMESRHAGGGGERDQAQILERLTRVLESAEQRSRSADIRVTPAMKTSQGEFNLRVENRGPRHADQVTVSLHRDDQTFNVGRATDLAPGRSTELSGHRGTFFAGALQGEDDDLLRSNAEVAELRVTFTDGNGTQLLRKRLITGPGSRFVDRPWTIEAWPADE